MKIGVSGCSNSSYTWGNPWHYFVGEYFNADIITSYSQGAGNEINIEKIKYILENNDLDYFILQITEPSRYVVGLDNVSTENDSSNQLRNGIKFKNMSFYTFNPVINDKNIKNITGHDYKLDDFYLKHIITSDFNLYYKVFHTLMTIQYLCDSFNVKLIMFSWFDDINLISKKSNYENIISKMNIIPDFVFNFTKQNHIEPIPNDGHFDSESHKKIFEGFLLPHLNKLIK